MRRARAVRAPVAAGLQVVGVRDGLITRSGSDDVRNVPQFEERDRPDRAKGASERRCTRHVHSLHLRFQQAEDIPTGYVMTPKKVEKLKDPSVIYPALAT